MCELDKSASEEALTSADERDPDWDTWKVSCSLSKSQETDRMGDYIRCLQADIEHHIPSRVCTLMQYCVAEMRSRHRAHFDSLAILHISFLMEIPPALFHYFRGDGDSEPEEHPERHCIPAAAGSTGTHSSHKLESVGHEGPTDKNGPMLDPIKLASEFKSSGRKSLFEKWLQGAWSRFHKGHTLSGQVVLSGTATSQTTSTSPTTNSPETVNIASTAERIKEET